MTSPDISTWLRPKVRNTGMCTTRGSVLCVREVVFRRATAPQRPRTNTACTNVIPAYLPTSQCSGARVVYTFVLYTLKTMTTMRMPTISDAAKALSFSSTLQQRLRGRTNPTQSSDERLVELPGGSPFSLCPLSRPTDLFDIKAVELSKQPIYMYVGRVPVSGVRGLTTSQRR